MRWIELFLTAIRDGLGHPISIECLLPHTGIERAQILEEVDAVARYHYKLKVVYEDKLRRRFGKIQGQNDADAEDEATATLVDGVVGEISFGELVKGDAIDMAAEETDESEESSEYETETDDSEESSEESSRERIPRPLPPRQPLRSHTVANSVNGPQQRQEGLLFKQVPRSRSASLKTSRSMTFSLPGKGHSSRHSADMPPPPVPALPGQVPLTALQKPLPPDPFSGTTDHVVPHKSRPKPSSVPLPGRKKATETLKPPDLEHIPNLLPVFTEIVCVSTLNFYARRADMTDRCGPYFGHANDEVT
jgi:hypothetical protein